MRNHCIVKSFLHNTWLITSLVLMSFSNLSAKDTLRVQLKWWHQFQFAGYYAAEIKGLYKEAGLNVKLLPGNKGISPLTEVLSGRAQLGITGAGLIVDYARGEPVVALGAVFQHSPYTILSLKKNKINSPTDLVGKRLMASPEQGWVELQAMLLREGISTDSIQLIAHSWNNEDLLKDNTDAITGYLTVELNQLRKMNANPTYILPINYGVDFYGDVLFATRNEVTTHPDQISQFRKASFAGWEYALNHPEEIADYILTLPGVKERNVTKEDLLAEAQAMKQLILPELVDIGHMNEGRWAHIAKVYHELGLIDHEPDLSGLLYDGTRKVNSNIFSILLYVVGGIIALLLIMLLYGLSLKRAVKKRTLELMNEIARRSKMQELLTVSEQRLEMATIAAGLGIWDWDINTNEVYYNDQWKNMLGFAPQDLPNNFDTFVQLLHPEEKENLLQQLQKHVDGELDSYQAIVRLRTKDKRWKWVLTVSKASLRNHEGKAIRLSGIHLDLDDIKQKEIELQELSKELMNSNRELQQFAYITSHNLRAPVANLISLLSLFDKENLSERNQVFLEKIELSVEKLLLTLNDLNEILSSRTHQSDTFEELDFQQEIDHVCTMLAEDIRLKEVTIVCELEKAPTINYSGKILRSILLNLINNAIKYRHPNRPPVIQITTSSDGEFVLLTVKDNGLGLDMNKYGNKIFGLYQRFHEGKEGKGLGLYIIKHQVEALEGKIAVDSIVDQGTMFHVFLKKKRPFNA